MKLLRTLLRLAAAVVALWLLLPVLRALNALILTWFNVLLDDSLVDRKTLDFVTDHIHQQFLPLALPRLGLLFLLIIGTWVTLRLTRPRPGKPVSAV